MIMMGTWFITLVSLFIISLLKICMSRLRNCKNLPPGPSFFSSNLVMLTNTFSELQLKFRNYMPKYGHFFTFFMFSHPFILVGSRTLAHKILFEKGAVFSDRPRFFRFFNISTASYGPTWRILRRNLGSEFLQRSRVNSYSWARKWALQNLIFRLQEAEGFEMNDHFHYAVFSLLLVMCFGYKLNHHRINNIRTVQRQLISFVGSRAFYLFSVTPWLAKILLRNKRKTFELLRSNQKHLLIQLINSRMHEVKYEQRIGKEQTAAYIDTLMKLQIPNDSSGNTTKLTQKDIVSMCSEFLNAGTDTTSTTLEWIMANLLKHPHIQRKLYDEIVAVVGPPPPPPPPGMETEESVYINEDDLQKMPYLQAVVLEGLRRHPPGYTVLPHRVTNEVEMEGYVIPQDAAITFMVREMGMDPTIWDDPLEFKPDRFLSNDSSNGAFDISGIKGIKMMPFGAGRRICPAIDLALLHLKYFVSNLIWYFEWTAPNGYHVDLSEKAEFTVHMKHPLQAQISARTKVNTS